MLIFVNHPEICSFILSFENISLHGTYTETEILSKIVQHLRLFGIAVIDYHDLVMHLYRGFAKTGIVLLNLLILTEKPLTDKNRDDIVNFAFGKSGKVYIAADKFNKRMIASSLWNPEIYCDLSCFKQKEIQRCLLVLHRFRLQNNIKLPKYMVYEIIKHICSGCILPKVYSEYFKGHKFCGNKI